MARHITFSPWGEGGPKSRMRGYTALNEMIIR